MFRFEAHSHQLVPLILILRLPLLSLFLLHRVYCFNWSFFIGLGNVVIFVQVLSSCYFNARK